MFCPRMFVLLRYNLFLSGCFMVYVWTCCRYHESMSIPLVLVNLKRYLKLQQVPKGPRGTSRSKRYLKVQGIPKGPSGA